MNTQQIVDLARKTLEMAVLLGAPLLIVVTVVSLLVNLVQVLTSLQDATLSTVPRLAAAVTAIFLLMPWMVRRISTFTLELFSDFHPFLGH